jgi:Fe-S-cluster containining protein
MTDTPFYASGLKFTCNRCSSCCRYDAGFVFLSNEDIEKLTTETKMDKKSFINTYCRWVIDWQGNEVLSLKEKSNKDCIFWDALCTVYKARPLQCITFPFWESVVSSKQSWEVAGSGCPGIDKGTLHSAESIKNCLKMRSEQPIINRESKS